MGVYERDYLRVGPRSASGMGALGLVSFNTWLIVINTIIFVAGILMSGLGTPVMIARTIDRPGVPANRQAVVNVYRLPSPDNRPVPDEWLTHASSKNMLQRTVVDTQNGEPVGVEYYQVMDPLQAVGHFSTQRGFLKLEVWRLVTFQFLHANFWHLAMNMFGLWVFGGLVEELLGFKRYAAFYLVCGIFGGVMYLSLNLLGVATGWRIPGLVMNDLYCPLVGASAGVFGVIVASAYIAPKEMVVLAFPPIALPMKWFAYGYVALALANLLFNSNNPAGNAGGDAAHLGGAIAGFFFIRNPHLLRDFFDVLSDSRHPRAAPKSGAPGGPDGDEVDRILAKAKQSGLGSLSAGEKQALRRATSARRRMR